MQRTTVGIIGLGSFGQFIAGLFAKSPTMRVIGYDPDEDITVSDTIERVTSIEVIARAHIVVLAAPLAAYPAILAQLQLRLPSQTLLVDVCSVKVQPQALIQQYLPNHRNLLLTHPLFSPQSAAKTTRGHSLIITRSAGPIARQVTAFCQHDLGLRITSMSAEEHDKVMPQPY